MLRLTKRRRKFLAEKFGDLGNLAVAALVFGQAMSSGASSWQVAVAGIAPRRLNDPTDSNDPSEGTLSGSKEH